MDKPTPPEPQAHMYPSDLERFAETETFAHAYSVAVGCPDERSDPLVTLASAIAHGKAMAAWGAAQYKEDAERYRWLRDTNLDAGVRATGEHLEPLQVPMIFIGHPEDQWTLGSFASAWVGEKFDRAIDAAIDKARKA